MDLKPKAEKASLSNPRLMRRVDASNIGWCGLQLSDTGEKVGLLKQMAVTVPPRVLRDSFPRNIT